MFAVAVTVTDVPTGTVMEAPGSTPGAVAVSVNVQLVAAAGGATARN
jgi:hypothetical protein